MAECLDCSYTVLSSLTIFGNTKFLVVALWSVFMARLGTDRLHF